LTPFQRLLILKVFRPEKLLYAAQDYVKLMMGRFFVDSIDSSMATIYADTGHATPLVFVLSVGADPMAELQVFAEKKEYAERMRRISLGQGQGQKAKDLVAASVITGDWVVLQNCHLAGIKFMPDLENMV
jgi:dynein heavy chain